MSFRDVAFSRIQTTIPARRLICGNNNEMGSSSNQTQIILQICHHRHTRYQMGIYINSFCSSPDEVWSESFTYWPL